MAPSAFESRQHSEKILIAACFAACLVAEFVRIRITASNYPPAEISRFRRLDFSMEPRFRVSPQAIGGARGDVQDFGGVRK